MIILIFIWLAGGVSITIAEITSAISHPEDETNWLEVIGVAVGWPLILIGILCCGMYNTITMKLW